MKSISLYLLLFVSGILYFSACKNEGTGQFTPKPAAMGRLNEIVVIADEDLWEGPLGDTFSYYFESAYPIMPNPESVFDLRHFTPGDLIAEPLRKELRTYVILADLSDKDSPTAKMVQKDLGAERFLSASEDGNLTTTVGKDKWARNQLIVYLLGKNKETLAKTIRENYAAVAQRVNRHDEKQLEASIYAVKREHAGYMALVEEMYHLQLRIPGDFKQAKLIKDEGFLWLRQDNKLGVLNMIIKKVKYEGPQQLTKEAMIKMRNENGSYIETNTKGSVMQTNDRDLPVYEYTYNLDGLFTKEIRGVWEMTDDFMGGPFISYAIVNDKEGQVIFVDNFIYAPGKNKRNMMQQLEYIVKHVKNYQSAE